NWYKGEILLRKGSYYHQNGNELKALELFNESLQACRLSENYRIMGATYSLMGTIFRINGLYDRAIEYIINSKLNYEKVGFTEGYAWAAYLLGRIYADLKYPQKAMEYFQEAVEIYKKIALTDRNENGIAICYEQIGLLNMELGNLNEAHNNIEYVLKVHTDNHSEYGISNAYKNLGMIEYHQENYRQAEDYLNKALKVKKEMGDLLSQPSVYEYLGLCLFKKGQQEEGFKQIFYGLKLAQENNQKKIESDIYSKLADTYRELNDLEKAVLYQDKQINIQDSLLSGAVNIKLDQLQAIYEIDAQNDQIAQLEKQNEINTLHIRQQKTYQFITIAGFLIALFGSLITYWFYRQMRRKNLELNEANASKDKLFAIISHDLRGPVGTQSSFLYQITSRFDEFSPNEVKEILINLHKSSETTSELLENLLAWARSQTNKIDFNPTQLNVSEALANALESIKHVAENKQIKINSENSNNIFVLADPDMLQAIIRNLVSNAVKFTNRGGVVLIKAETKDNQNALISVIDKGVGIEKSSLNKIFDIHHSHHTSGTEGEKSSGLGLILVKDFVERNLGVLSIESDPGKGTVVSFTLPLFL
ncbi:MAG: tetratricopeptide repeat-containing sensor histidine kinase, partial [Bacteroidales bacterium]|nr:tetratricopeptide repeat-containing sensor histidine kinase [Bacteroidales bacterium]